MTSVEILIAVLENVKCACAVISIFGIIALVITGIGKHLSQCEMEGMKAGAAKVWSEQAWHIRKLSEWTAIYKAWYGGFKLALAIVLICGPLAMIPSLTDIWRVRLALLKFELVSPESIKSGAETIERIGKKLECKYLGCEEKKDKQ